MHSKKTVTILMILSEFGFCCFFSCKGKDHRHDEIISVPYENTVIMAKISYPEHCIKNDKIVVWSLSPLHDVFFPDSITGRNLWIGPVLRKKLLENGYLNIEYIGRNDSIMFNNCKYRASDMNTKAKDLENILDFIRKNKHLKGKKIILAGHSEGAEINNIVGSKRQNDISAMLQLAASAQSGREFFAYQRERSIFELTMKITRHGNQEQMDSTTNKVSSLDCYHKANVSGTRQFYRENIDPVEDFIFQFDNNDSIYFYIDKYLRSRWEKESGDTKGIHDNNFEKYYQTFAGYITPHQTALGADNPEKYYPFVRCPVLAVHGTKDEQIDCYPNIERMEQLLARGGNLNFEKMILDGYNHNLTKGDDGQGYMVTEDSKVASVSYKNKIPYHIEDSVINRIVEWIDKQ
jgi:pimeloyl-ACP methyl ester carboxylesterase